MMKYWILCVVTIEVRPPQQFFRTLLWDLLLILESGWRPVVWLFRWNLFSSTSRWYYRKSSIKPLRGSIYFKPIWGGRAYLRGGNWNRKWKSSSTRRLEVMQPRIRMKSELPVGKIDHPGSVHTKLLQSWLINTVYYLSMMNNLLTEAVKRAPHNDSLTDILI